MTFTAPFGLVALLLVPAVVVLHLFRRRLPERRVAGLFLWSEERLVATAGRRRTRLLQTLPLWLESLAALVLALWLAGPDFGAAAARHVAIVLDDSASMAAFSDGETVTARVRALLRERLGSLAPSDRVTVLRSGARPDLLVGPAALRAEVDPALPAWRPLQPSHDVLPALDFARELAGPAGDVWLCTDRPLPAAGPGVSVFALGRPAANAALLSCSRQGTADGGEHVRATIAGFGGLAATAVRVRIDGTEVARATVDLGAGPVDWSLPLPRSQQGQIVHLELLDDALAADNEAALLPAAPREVLVADLLPAEVRAALQLERALAAAGGCRAAAQPRAAQLVFAPSPGQLAPGQIEVVVGASSEEREAWVGPFALDRSHPWLFGLQLEGVAWVAGKGALPGRVLIAAGSKTLASLEDDGVGRRLWLDLEPGAGNVVRAPDWPLLVANLVASARAEVPGPERQEVVLGMEARYRRSMVAGALDAQLELLAPDGTRTKATGVRTLAWLPRTVGLHSVRGADDRELAAFAIRFVDPAESDLAAAATRTEPATAGARAATADDGAAERRWLALLLLVVVVLDWWVLAGPRSRIVVGGH